MSGSQVQWNSLLTPSDEWLALDELTDEYVSRYEAEAKLSVLRQRNEVLEAALLRVHSYRNGYCRDCGEFTGYDQIQEIQGDAPHSNYCHIATELKKLGLLKEASS